MGGNVLPDRVMPIRQGCKSGVTTRRPADGQTSLRMAAMNSCSTQPSLWANASARRSLSQSLRRRARSRRRLRRDDSSAAADATRSSTSRASRKTAAYSALPTPAVTLIDTPTSQCPACRYYTESASLCRQRVRAAEERQDGVPGWPRSSGRLGGAPVPPAAGVQDKLWEPPGGACTAIRAARTTAG